MADRLDCILLVDDSDADNFLHRLVIEESGRARAVEAVRDGQAALTHLQRARRGEATPPQLVLLDINMPVLDGWGFLEAAQADGLLDGTVTVVAMLSTTSDPRERARAGRYPFVQDFLTKPLTADALARIVDAL